MKSKDKSLHTLYSFTMIAIIMSYGFKKIHRCSLSSYNFHFIIGFLCLQLAIKYYNKYLDILTLSVLTTVKNVKSMYGTIHIL